MKGDSIVGDASGLGLGISRVLLRLGINRVLLQSVVGRLNRVLS